MGKISIGIKRFINNPRIIIYYLNSLGWLNNLSDRKWVELIWWSKTGKKLDLDNPRSFNEKIQWLMVYDHRPEYTKLVDKYLVRNYVEDTVGSKYLVPLLGVWDSPDEINFDLLPNQFVLKCNHNSGEGMCVCRTKEKIDIPTVKKKLRHALSKNYYYGGREWSYKNVHPRILCEQFIVDNDPNNTAGTLIDYKFYCFNGEPKFLYVGVDDISSGTKGDAKLSFVDLDWKTPPFYRTDHEPIPVDVEKPERFDEMIKIAKDLSKGFPFVRVDLYWVNEKIYFSEMTFYPGAGYGFFSPEEWEKRLGDWIILPTKTED